MLQNKSTDSEINPIMLKNKSSSKSQSESQVNQTDQNIQETSYADNLNYILKNISKLSNEEKQEFLKKIQQINKNLPFDLFNLYTDYKRSTLTGNKCYPHSVGVEYSRVKSLLRKKLNSDENKDKSENNSQQSTKGDKYIGLKDISKMSIKERVSYKQNQLELNSKYDLYEDLKSYIDNELKKEDEIKNIKNQSNPHNERVVPTKLDFHNQIQKYYNEVVLNDMNEIIMNNILDNKKIYMGLVIVRKERLENLYDKFIDYYKNL
jgi:hypothetical protein